MAKFEYAIENGPLAGKLVTIEVPNQEHADVAIHAALNHICEEHDLTPPDEWKVRQLPRDN